MAVSLKWVSDYVDINGVDLLDLANKITCAGINIEAVNKKRIDNIVIGKVIECCVHPDSDHLHVCKVDIGNEVLDIVCGAHNVRKGIKVIVAKIGTILPGNFEIKKGVIRGVESNGMLCGLFELGVEEKTEENYAKGIHEVDQDVEIGIDANNYLGLDDTSYELDLNPNRTDCNNHLSFAYEVAAVLKKEVKLPEISYCPIKSKIDVDLIVETENCTMYNMKIAKDIVIKESPKFIKDRLNVAGIRSINNVVDISNYVMLEYGQPLHFFDKDKVGNQIVVRMANENETITTLDGENRVLNDKDIIISDSKKPLCIAGIMGGINSGIDENTRDVLIESAMFNPYNIRYTSIRLGLRSEASNRFEKPLNYEYCNLAIERACYLLEKYADAKIVDEKKQYDNVDKRSKSVKVSLNQINSLLGLNMTIEDVNSSLKGLGFEYKLEKENYEVTIPNRRQDIYEQKEDIIEEVGRLYGYDKIVPTLPKIEIKSGKYEDSIKFKKIISKRMRTLGFHEIKTYTLISDDNSKKYNYNNGDFIYLNKPMNKDKSVIRQSLLSSIEDVVKYNLKVNNNNILIYEIANTYSGYDEYVEDTKLSFAVTGNYINKVFNSEKFIIDFYFIKGIIENLFDFLGLSNRYTFKLCNVLPKEIHPKINSEVIVGGKTIGYFGKLHPSIIKEDVYVCEISLTKLLANKTGDVKLKELNKYPIINKDVAFIVDEKINSIDIINQIRKSGGKLLTNINIFDIYRGENIGEDKKSLAYKLTFEDNNRTLTEEEVMKLFDKIIIEVKSKFSCEIRDK